MERVLSFYPLEVKNIHLKESRSGRTTWEIETDKGAKILKQAEMNPRRMMFIAAAHIHLQENGLPITPIQKTKNGALCIGAEDHAYVLYDKVQGHEMIYYNTDQLSETLKFAAKFHKASKGYVPLKGSKKRSRLGKWAKLYRWKLQELEGNKHIAESYTDDEFSRLFLEHVDSILERGKKALKSLEEEPYQTWSKQVIEERSFCQQDFTMARFTEVDGTAFMKELHSITYDLPARDLRILLNKVMKKMSVWDHDLAIHMLSSYDSINPLTEDQYKVLWADLAFPHLFCSIVHKYYLGQKRSWSDEKYIWAIQNIIAVETSKEEFLKQFSSIYSEIKKKSGGMKDE
ncbi:CotS family spore coat protein [Bacillus timonensis]|nr:CotS family spore coat protein [Bacillus timonensis]